MVHFCRREGEARGGLPAEDPLASLRAAQRRIATAASQPRNDAGVGAPRNDTALHCFGETQ